MSANGIATMHDGDQFQHSAEYARRRLAIAARVAAGLSANPEIMAMKSWEGEVARAAWNVAGRLMLLAESGGC